MEAAFFDLDKTVIAKASIMAFAPHFRQEGLLTRRSMAKGLWTQLVYLRFGATGQQVDRIRNSVLSVTRGWDRDHVREVVASRLVSVVDPITYAEARALIEDHLRAGRRVYVVSAAPSEIVEPLARHLGAHEAVASVARVDTDGRYTGVLESYAFGVAKAEMLRRLAARDGIDLSASYAYSDVPMLEAVGHAVAVNPDRALRKLAAERGWAVVRFREMYRASTVAGGSAGDSGEAPSPVAPRPEADGPGGTRRRRVQWLCRVSVAAAAAAASGGATALVWRYRSQVRQA